VRKEFDEHSDVYVINTCSVTENADRECKAWVSKAQKKNPEALIAVIGCYAQLKPEKIASLEGVDLVLGAKEKFRLPEYIAEMDRKSAETALFHCAIPDVMEFHSSFSSDDRTRAFLKVQDGCDYSCSFCTIPLARGKSRSDTIENVLKKASVIAASGVKEIVLTGVNLGDFGNNEEDFYQLISGLDQVNEKIRFRISSIEPNLLHDRTIEFVARSEKFVPHFHIPLQSGSNEILGLMRRRYRRELYAGRVAKIKALLPDCCIGVDVITGFPGETENLFNETFEFLRSLEISYLHVFTYSERENTLAAGMDGKVPLTVRKKRTAILRALSEEKLKGFYASQSGTLRTVLFENENRNGWLYGYSENYLRMRIPFSESSRNSFIQVITGKAPDLNPIDCIPGTTKEFVVK
jgi:threonylcarbamoyladenosine tRNA methylthiotransferase MtaB